MSEPSQKKERLFITLEVIRVTYQRAVGGWTCVQAKLDSEQPLNAENYPRWLQSNKFSVTGELGAVQPGDLLDVEGTPDRHPRYGWQIKATRVASCVRRDNRALYSFLRRLPQVGERRAGMIQQTFDDADAIFEMLEHDPRQLTAISGINEERALEIHDSFMKLRGLRDTWTFCQELNLPSRLTARILDKLKGAARELISHDPFLLMTEMGAPFKDCEIIRVAMGISDDDPRRLAAGTLFVMQSALRNGDCWCWSYQLTGGGVDRQVDRARQHIELRDTEIQAGLQVLQQPTTLNANVEVPPRVVLQDDRYYLADIYRAERKVAERVLGMLAA